MIDATIIRAHQHAAGAEGGQEKQALGRSCGGFSTKIHAKVDALGMPLDFIVTAGQVHDSQLAQALLNDDYCDYLIADRGYDDDEFRKELWQHGTCPVIPGKKNRREPVKYDQHIYKERNFIERFLIE